MSKATEPHTTTEPESPWDIGDIEPLLHDMEAQAGILGHMGSSDNTIEPGELLLIQSHFIDLHAQLTEVWRSAWDGWIAGKHKAEAAHAAVKAARDEYGVPGSATDIPHAEMMWRMLAAAAGSITEGYEKREARIAVAADAEPEAEPIAATTEDSPDVWAGATS